MSDQPDQPDAPDEEVSELRTHVEMPEGSVLLGAVEAVSYLNPDGETCYGFRWPAEMSFGQVLGLLELVKSQVLVTYHAQYPPLTDED